MNSVTIAEGSRRDISYISPCDKHRRCLTLFVKFLFEAIYKSMQYLLFYLLLTDKFLANIFLVADLMFHTFTGWLSSSFSL